MAQKDTARSILDAAEELFSERGFAETSLRNITTKADVNLAAVKVRKKQTQNSGLPTSPALAALTSAAVTMAPSSSQCSKINTFS